MGKNRKSRRLKKLIEDRIKGAIAQKDTVKVYSYPEISLDVMGGIRDPKKLIVIDLSDLEKPKED